MNERLHVGATDVKTDALLDGRLMLRQSRNGHRAGTDAILLAAAARVFKGDVLVDVGAGVGTVGLALALRDPDVTGTLLDLDSSAIALAAQNCRLNGVGMRIRAVTCDLFDSVACRAADVGDECASVVVTNPPFFTADAVRVSPDRGKARAHALLHVERPIGHADWLRAALRLLAPKGRFYMIHRPEALPALLGGCENRLGALALLPVHAKAEGPAVRILVSGVKGSRGPLRICPPLILHRSRGGFTPEAEALHRGETVLAM